MWRARLDEISDNPRIARATWWTIAILVSLLQLFIRGINIDHPELWLDESSTYGVAVHPLLRVFTLPTEFHSQPPLYYLVLHFLIKVSSERWVIRGLSWLCCFLLMQFVLFFADELTLLARVFFCLLFLFSAESHYLSTALRPYGMAALFTVVSSVMFVRMLRDPTRHRAVVYVIWTVLLLYTMAFDVGVALAQGLFITAIWIADAWKLGVRGMLSRHRYSVAAMAACAVAYAPYLLMALHFQYRPNATPTFHHAWNVDIYTSGLQELFGSGLVPQMSMVYAFAGVALLAGLRDRDVTVWSWPLVIVVQIAFVWVFIVGRSAIGVQGRYMVPAYVATAVLATLGFQRAVPAISRTAWTVLTVWLLYTAWISFQEFHQYMHTPLPVGKWESLRNAMKKQPGKKVIFFDVGYSGQDFEYVIRKDADIVTATERGRGWASGGEGTLSEAYINDTIERALPDTRCFYYYLEAPQGRYAQVFLPAMKRHNLVEIEPIGNTHGFCKRD